jgi:hypothetical protein
MSEFTFKPNSAGMGVTWTMTEQDGFFGKAARIVFHLASSSAPTSSAGSLN